MKIMTNNTILLNELFIEIDYDTISKDRNITDVLKDKMTYIKNATRYISITQLYKLYKNLNKVYEERSKDKYLEEIEYNMIIYFIYLLNTNIITEEEKISLINNILFLYDKRLTNQDILNENGEAKLKVYAYTDISSKYIHGVKNQIQENTKESLLPLLEEDINLIMIEYKDILERDIESLNKTKVKKRIR